MMTDSMHGSARQALKLYLDQSPHRSLQRLIAHCKENNVDVSIATLKRWSVRYEWQRHVAEHDRALAEEATAITHNRREQAVCMQLSLAKAALDRYGELIDAINLDQTPARPGRRDKVKIRDFLKLIEIEEQLWKRLETMQQKEPRTSKQTVTPEESDAMMRALAEVRYGLPRQT